MMTRTQFWNKFKSLKLARAIGNMIHRQWGRLSLTLCRLKLPSRVLETILIKTNSIRQNHWKAFYVSSNSQRRKLVTQKKSKFQPRWATITSTFPIQLIPKGALKPKRFMRQTRREKYSQSWVRSRLSSKQCKGIVLHSNSRSAMSGECLGRLNLLSRFKETALRQLTTCF